ncbi:MAG: hypothetical protein NVS3B10_15700 [Polyangiales bacterium]
MRAARWLAVGALAAMALACAKREAIVNPDAPMWLHRPSWALHVTFRRLLVAEQGLAAKTGLEKGVPAIDPQHGRIFVGTSDRALYALRAGDGSTLWRFQTAGTVQCEPAYDEELDTVFFGSDDAGMYAARARDGKLRWRYATGAEVQKRPIVVVRPNGKKIVVFVNAADSVFAADAQTGQPLWKRVRTPALGLEVSGHAGVAVDHDRVYAAFSTGKVVAYDVDTGQDKWPEVDLSAPTGAGQDNSAQTYFDVDTTPVVHGDRVFVASVMTGVYALDATGAAQIWKRPEAQGVSWLTYWSEPAHTDPTTKVTLPERALLIAGSGTTGLWALDPKSGEVRWRAKAPRGAFSHPVVLGGALLVTSSKLGLYLFDPLHGQPIDGIDPGTGFSGGAASYENRAFVVDNAGVLLGIDVTPPSDGPRTAKTW